MEQARVESRSRKINAVHHDTTRQWENHRPPLEFQDMADDSLKLYQIWLNTDCVHLNEFFLLTIFHEKNTWTDLRYLKINLKCSSYNLRKWHYVSYGWVRSGAHILCMSLLRWALLSLSSCTSAGVVAGRYQEHLWPEIPVISHYPLVI